MVRFLPPTGVRQKEHVMSEPTFGRWLALAGVVALAACGGGGSSGPSTPTSPTTNPGSSTHTINIVSTTGAQSLTPNTATQTARSAVTIRNGDGVVHRIVANDGSFDTGDIAPGATSRNVQASSAGANYHCSIHPAMIGAIGSTQGEPPPPCSGAYC
jgi:plastocyanin